MSPLGPSWDSNYVGNVSSILLKSVGAQGSRDEGCKEFFPLLPCTSAIS